MPVSKVDCCSSFGTNQRLFSRFPGEHGLCGRLVAVDLVQPLLMLLLFPRNIIFSSLDISTDGCQNSLSATDVVVVTCGPGVAVLVL